MPAMRDWLLRQMHARDAMDGVVLVVRLAVHELGPKKVARELRRLDAPRAPRRPPRLEIFKTVIRAIDVFLESCLPTPKAAGTYSIVADVSWAIADIHFS